MPLTETEINQENEYFSSVAKAQNMEIDKVIENFNHVFDELSKLPSLKTKPRRVIIKRTRSALNAMFSNREQEGEPFVFIPFGPVGRPKDWNEGLFDHIKSEQGRGNIKGLVKDGRVMTMKKDGRDVPVSKIIAHEVKDVYLDKETKRIYNEQITEDLVKMKQFVVTKGEEWKKGEGKPLLSRDHRLFIGRGTENQNWGWSFPLRHNFQMNVRGIACPQETVADIERADWRLMDITVRGNQADIEHKDFFLKSFEPFQCYVGNFKVNEKGTTEWRYGLNAKQVVATAFDNPFKDKDGNERQLDDVIEELFGTLKNMFTEEVEKTKVGKSTDKLPDFLDGFRELEQYHLGEEVTDENGNVDYANSFSGQVKRKSNGEVDKTRSNWDRTHWNKYGIMRVDVSEIIEPSKPDGNYRYKFSDSTVPYSLNVWASDYIFKQPRPIPCTCLVMFQSARRPDRWDPITRDRIDDPENGELLVQLGTIGKIPEMEDIEIPEMELL